MNLFKSIKEDKKLVVFDFDGVLVDSVNIKTKAFGLMYKEYGSDVVDKVQQHHVENGGMSRFHKFKHYHKIFLGKSLDEDDIQMMSNKFSDLVVSQVVSSKWIPGAENFLQLLHKNHMNCVIVSATPQSEIELIIEKRNMNKYFSNIYGSPDSKSNNLTMALKKNSITSDEAVFFGDALADWQAAGKINIPFIGVGQAIRDLVMDNDESSIFIDNFEEIKDV